MEFTTNFIPGLLNISNVNNATTGQSYSDRYPATVLLIALGIIGPIGNAHALYIYAHRFQLQRRQHQTLQNPYLVFVLSLAILDLFSCIAILPTDDVYFTMKFTPLSESVCKVQRYFQYVVQASGLFHIVLISIHCWRMMCHPYSWQIKGRVAIKFCVFFHMFSLLLCSPVAVVTGLSNEIIDGEVGPICAIVENNDGSDLLKIGMGIVGFILISSLITICATNVSVIIARFRKKGLIAHCKSDQDKEKARKTAAILSVLTGFFLVAYVPFLIIGVIAVSTTDFIRNRGAGAAVRLLALKFPFFNNVVNPFIYGVRDEEFRRRLLKMYHCIKKKSKKSTESNTSMEII